MKNGYLTGLTGSNGAGKSTLLHILAGIEPRFQGDFLVDGVSFRKAPSVVKDKVAFVSKEVSFFWEKNALENAGLLGRYYSQWDMAVYREWLERLELKEEQPLCELSCGGRMKHQIAFAMAHKPCIFLMDEPTAGFDPVFRKEFKRILQEMMEEDRCILMSTNITDDLDKIADKTMVLEAGRLIGKGSSNGCNKQ